MSLELWLESELAEVRSVFFTWVTLAATGDQGGIQWFLPGLHKVGVRDIRVQAGC